MARGWRMESRARKASATARQSQSNSPKRYPPRVDPRTGLVPAELTSRSREGARASTAGAAGLGLCPAGAPSSLLTPDRPLIVWPQRFGRPGRLPPGAPTTSVPSAINVVGRTQFH
jgi:hypothetical protein